MTALASWTDISRHVRYLTGVMVDLAASVAARMLRPAIAGMISQGHDPAPVLARLGVRPELLADQDARVPHALALQLWQAATEVTGDINFGLHAAEAIDFSMLDVQSHTILASANLSEGLERACRYQRLQHDAAVLSLEPNDDGSSTLRHTLPGGRALPRQPAEFFAAVWVLIARQATGTQVVPRNVRLSHPRPGSIDEHVRLFGVEPEFDRDERSACFEASDLDRPLLKADSALQAVLDRHAQDLLDRLPKVHNVADQVRAIVTRELTDGDSSLEHVAEQLRMSPRTLNRRLADEGTSHRAVLEELREQLARRYLQDPQLGVSEVAYLLGFSEASAFHRAFKRWTGKTPAAFRSA